MAGVTIVGFDDLVGRGKNHPLVAIRLPGAGE